MNGLAGWQVFQLPSGTFGTALWSTLALSSLVWCASLWRRDASLVDRFWAVFIALNALVYAGALGWLEGSSPARRATVLVLVALLLAQLGMAGATTAQFVGAGFATVAAVVSMTRLAY